jgi:hypothetical protein
MMNAIAPALPLERRIWIIRGRRVMLDFDLADIYGVPTKRLNEQVRRNSSRFPRDFMFHLTRVEARTIGRLRSRNATLKRGKHIKHLPAAFTEHGAVMLASVLNSPAAVAASIQVVKAFVRLRELIVARDRLGRKVSDLERHVAGHSTDISRIFNVLEELLEPGSPSNRKRIGFVP